MNRRSSFAETLTIAFVFGLAGCEQKTEHAEAPPPPEVLVTQVVKADVPIVHQWVGTLDGSDNADIRARVTGYLQKRNYQEGSFVKEGDLLFEIDPRPFEAALAQAKSDLAQAQAIQLATQAQFERNQELFNKKVISVQEYENTRQLNEANVAKVGAADAALQTAQLNLGFTKITAPFDGIAGVSQAQIGDLVGPTGSTSTLTNESKVDPIRLYFPISESEYRAHSNLLRDAMNKPESERQEIIEMLFADGTVYPKRGRFSFVNRQVDPTTGTIMIAANFPNPDRTLRPGQFAVARAAIENLPDALLVPERALVDLQGNYQLGVVGADNKAEIRAVKIGPMYNRQAVVTEGVKEGEKVIVEGMQKVRQGMVLTAKPYEEPKADTANSRRPRERGTLQAEQKAPSS
ncbi:MAG: efflux RND transporter periplasmic adaptor subunit [Verrucomicrobia bacterium]|nr:efflux RND transporter periplasmic adaptor subunit [Verrucomicrobiota bacterium]MBV8273725.1 efflux RND transporter periplasmic adaptor subunit [Verrucomicrobiota bacterium]